MKFCQLRNKPAKNCSKDLEILPNLVTLTTAKVKAVVGSKLSLRVAVVVDVRVLDVAPEGSGHVVLCGNYLACNILFGLVTLQFS